MWWQQKPVYLDYASAAPVIGQAERAFRRAGRLFGNPSSPHREGRESAALLEGARHDIAHVVECKSDDVVFTSGATEANNLAVRGLVRPGSRVLVLPTAHASIIESVRALEGVIVDLVPIREGQIDVKALSALVHPATALVALEAVCGETGTIWNTREVRNALEKLGTKRPLLLVDASQAALTQKLTRAHYGADLLVFDAQKVGGYRGVGVLIAPRTIPLLPILFGGGQERGLRSGTPAPALAAAFAAALLVADKQREGFVARARLLRDTLVHQVSKIPGAFINEGREVAPHILNLTLLGRDTDYLVTLLDAAGFAVSTRSACETDSAEGSRAVLGLTGDPDRARATIRISWGRETRARDLEAFFHTLAREVEFIDNPSAKSHN